MTCPNCGLQTLPDQKFCRTCGKSLRMVAPPVESGLKSDLVKNSAAFEGGKLGSSNWMLLAFVLLFVGAAIGVVGKKLLHEDIVTTVGVLIALAGMFATVYPYIRPSPRPKDHSSPTPQPLPQSLPTKELNEDHTQYIPSVTEKTTTLLDTSARIAKRPEDEHELSKKHVES